MSLWLKFITLLVIIFQDFKKFTRGSVAPTIPSQQQAQMAYYRPKVPEETYKFSQCFGDKNDHAEINDGTNHNCLFSFSH